MKKGYITLKEASKLSGYSSDYIGQLIRQGKIEGKQVYSNVAWVTTKKALAGYLKKSKQGELREDIAISRAGEHTTKLFQVSFYAIVACLAILFLFVFYIFSSSVESRLDKKALNKIEANLLNYE
jgi:hypothetical protein